MGRIKHLMDEVAEKMGVCDPNDPKVLAEVGRLLSLDALTFPPHSDIKYAIQTVADQIAKQRYGRELNDLPKPLQFEVWCEAESIVEDKVADQADAVYERLREQR